MDPDWRTSLQFRSARSLHVAAAVVALASLAVVGLVACGSSSDSGSTGPSVPLPTRSSSPTSEKTAKSALPEGPVTVLTIEVAEPVDDLGRVPLNTPVQGEWRLRNTGTTPISVGRLSIEVLEGC